MRKVRGGETSPRLIFRKSKINISLVQQFQVPYSLFLSDPVEDYQKILKLMC